MTTSSSHLQQEGIALTEAYRACGFRVPPVLPGNTLRAVVAGQFMPEESAPVLEPHGLDAYTERYFLDNVCPGIDAGIANEDPAIFELGRAAGRYLGAAIEANTIMTDPPMRVFSTKVEVDEQRVGLAFWNSRVVEVGMGVNGLLSHVESVRAGWYRVAAISNHMGEVALLDGLASYFGVEEGIVNDGNGVSACLNDMLHPESPYVGGTDMVVVSRVWTKDSEFKRGLTRIAELLRPGGVVIARGTAANEDGRMGYKAIGRVLETDPRLDVGLRHSYERSLPSGRSIKQQLTVAYREPFGTITLGSDK